MVKQKQQNSMNTVPLQSPQTRKKREKRSKLTLRETIWEKMSVFNRNNNKPRCTTPHTPNTKTLCACACACKCVDALLI